MGARGPKPMPEEDRRRYRIGVWFSENELHSLEAGMAAPGLAALVIGGSKDERKRFRAASELMRAKVLGERVKLKVPEINALAHAELGRLGSNINQTARAINSGFLDLADRQVLRAVIDDIRRLRDVLSGAMKESQQEEDEESLLGDG